MSIIEHGAIGHSFMGVGKMLEILVVCCYDCPCAFFTETFQHAFGYSATNLRFCSRAKLIYENKRVYGSLTHHVFHV